MAPFHLAPEMTEEQTFDELAAPHLEELRRLTGKLSDTADEAEELFQETVAAGVAAFPRLRRPELLGAWLQQICRRKRIDVLRRRYRERKLRDLPQLEVMERSEQVDTELVHRVLRELKPDERRLIELKYFQSKSSKEIAAILGRPSGTVRSLIFYTLRKFEGLFRALAGEEH